MNASIIIVLSASIIIAYYLGKSTKDRKMPAYLNNACVVQAITKKEKRDYNKAQKQFKKARQNKRRLSK